jgi:hypothetical protein
MFSDSTVNDKNSLTEIFTGPLVGPKVSFDWTEILNIAYVIKTCCSAPETVNTPINSELRFSHRWLPQPLTRYNIHQLT